MVMNREDYGIAQRHRLARERLVLPLDAAGGYRSIAEGVKRLHLLHVAQKFHPLPDAQLGGQSLALLQGGAAAGQQQTAPGETGQGGRS